VQKRLVINSSAIETRVALIEGNSLAELQIERSGERSVVGNIYKGRVLRVLPGMQAAFVDIGLDKAAFMHVSDFWPPSPEEAGGEASDEQDPLAPARDIDLEASLLAYVDEIEEGDGRAAPATGEPDAPAEIPVGEGETGVDEASRALGDAIDALPDPRPPKPPPLRAIEDALQKGQEIVVQISKEPIGSKGARITSHISLPGRYVVYMPTTDHIGVSRRIEDDRERKRLREIVASGRPPDAGGFIVRTACEGVSKREITADMRFLVRLWDRIQKRGTGAPAPTILHEDLDITLRAIRDLFTSEVAQVIVDRAADHQRVVEFIEGVLQPKLKSRVQLHEAASPIFDHFGVETQVQRALERRVWLKSGGYLVFDQTEALTAIDVNTGRFVGKHTHEETVLKTNLEAARVAIDQLRLRNIGGIIIIDFIDMEDPENHKKVSEALAEAVKRDKARTNILRISELGLVQMTRKRTRDNLRQLLTTACPTCRGDGRIRSVESVGAEVLRSLRRRAASTGDVVSMRVRVAPAVAEALGGPLRKGLDELERELGVRLAVATDASLARDHHEIDAVTSSREEEPAPTPAGPREIEEAPGRGEH
jgi:ribonuclease G